MKLAIITGASRGLGRALVDALLEQGYRVMGCGRSMCNFPKKVLYFQTDLSQAPQFIDDFEFAWSKLDKKNLEEVLLVNNAGILSPVDRLENCSSQDLIRQIQVNTIAPLLINRWLLQKTHHFSGRVMSVGITSGAAERPVAGSCGYCTSKAATTMMSRCLFEEGKYPPLRKQKFEVWDFSPGIMDTQMQTLIRSKSAEAFPEVQRAIDAKKENRLPTPAKVAQRFLELLSDPPKNAVIQR